MIAHDIDKITSTSMKEAFQEALSEVNKRKPHKEDYIDFYKELTDFLEDEDAYVSGLEAVNDGDI